MHCKITCSVAIIFLVISLYMILAKDNSDLDLQALLTDEQKETYKQIVNERYALYFTGFVLGLLLTLCFIAINYRFKVVTRVSLVCLAVSVSFLVQYFYYVLSPKSTYMVLHLDGTHQKEAWVKVYRKMQINYHVGFILGITFVGLLCYSV